MVDPRRNDPHRPDPIDPLDPAADPVYREEAADPRVSHHTVVNTTRSGGDRFGLIAAGVIAVLLVIAVIAFNMGPSSTDPGTTAAVPEAGQTMESAPAPTTGSDDLGAAPAAPLDEGAVPAPETEAAPAEPTPAPAQ
jgi:hypothetical protein